MVSLLITKSHDERVGEQIRRGKICAAILIICALNCGWAGRKVVKKERSFCGVNQDFPRGRKAQIT
jgi:hypothetical protein